MERLDNRVAIFSALDKVTATIKTLEIPINETKQFGALKVTPRVCYSRPQTEQPKTTSFVEVDEVGLEGTREAHLHRLDVRAEAPGSMRSSIHVFDVWLTDCRSRAARSPNSSRRPCPAPKGAPEGGEEFQAPPGREQQGSSAYGADRPIAFHVGEMRRLTVSEARESTVSALETHA